MSWHDLEVAAPDLAAFGAARFGQFEVAYLATVQPDGAPRVHPITPIVGGGHLFVFMEPTSPKGRDLQRDDRYALHGVVSNSSGASGEFYVSGRARLIADPALRATAVASSSYQPADRYILFELLVGSATAITYPDGKPVRQRWTNERS